MIKDTKVMSWQQFGIKMEKRDLKKLKKTLIKNIKNETRETVTNEEKIIKKFKNRIRKFY